MIVLKIILYPVGLIIRLALALAAGVLYGALGIYIWLPFLIIASILGPLGVILWTIVSISFDDLGKRLGKVFSFVGEGFLVYFSGYVEGFLWVFTGHFRDH